MAKRADFPIFRGEDILLSCAMDPTENITGWTIAFYGVGLSIAASITDAANGLFTVTITRAQTAKLSPGSGKRYDIWRTNSGAEEVLTYGFLEILDAARPGP